MSERAREMEREVRERLEVAEQTEPKWPICRTCRVTVEPGLLCHAPRCPWAKRNGVIGIASQ